MIGDDNKSKNIWKYLDGEMNQAELNEFKNMFSSDPELEEELRISEHLHHDLEKIYNQRAPASILTRVLDKVDDITILEKSAVRSIVIIAVLMVIGATTTLFLPKESPGTGYLDLSWTMEIMSSQGFVLFALISMMIFALLLVDHFLLRPRVPR